MEDIYTFIAYDLQAAGLEVQNGLKHKQLLYMSRRKADIKALEGRPTGVKWCDKRAGQSEHSRERIEIINKK